MYEYDLIGIGIFVKVICHAFPGRSEDYFAIVVHQHRLPGAQIIVFRRNMESVEAAVFELFIVYGFGGNAVGVAHLNNLSGCIGMVKQGVIIAEPFGAEQFLVVKRTVWFSELGMSFLRDLSQCVVVHRQRVV
jgi:hypothetical protein